MVPTYSTSLPSRFWNRVEPDENGCWLWLGYTLDGYGRIRMNGNKHSRVHRLAAADYYGAIPNGRLVLHHCDIRNCVNPEHLYYGTVQDNLRDMRTRGRLVAPPVHIGESNPQAKFTEATVREARRLYATGDYSQSALARKYGVASYTMRMVLNRTHWKHVE